MAQRIIEWPTGVRTDQATAKQAALTVAPTLKFDGTDGSDVLTTVALDGTTRVTLLVESASDPGTLTKANLDAALTSVRNAATAAEAQDATDRATLAAFDQAMADYIALASPTAAQTTAAVKAQARAWRYVVRRLVRTGIL